MAGEVIRTADVVLLAHTDEWFVLLIERGWDPFKGCLALPGGHVDDSDEFPEDAAHRELLEETGISVGLLKYLDTYNQPGRDPRGRYATDVFGAVIGHLPPPTAGDDATAARWVLVDEALASSTRLAFDHKDIVHDALRVLI